MAACITCGSELHPERAEKYNYCTAAECQEKNARGLTVVAVGQNKSAEQYMVLDEHVRDEIASGRYHDQRRASSGGHSPGSTDTETAGRRRHHRYGIGLRPRQVPRGAPAESRRLQALRVAPGAHPRRGSRCFTTSRGCGQTRSRGGSD